MTVHLTKYTASARTLADLKTLAKKSPEEAVLMLKAVKTSLNEGAFKAEGALLAKLVRADAKGAHLLERLEATAGIDQIFPAYRADALVKAGKDGKFTKAERNTFSPAEARAVERQGAVGTQKFTQADLRTMTGEASWNALKDSKAGERVSVTGKVTFKPDNTATVKIAGKVVPLVASDVVADYIAVPVNYMSGLVKDGPMVLQGEMRDGKFHAEAFAPRMDGLFDTFTAGRINTEVAGEVTLRTPRGTVYVTDAAFLQQMTALPRLACVLPGEAELVHGRLEYRHNPEQYLALGRPNNGAVDAAGSHTFDIAYSVFAGKPVHFTDAPAADRLSHGNRAWLLGRVTLEGKQTVSFEASYLSASTDDKYLEQAQNSVEILKNAVRYAYIEGLPDAPARARG